MLGALPAAAQDPRPFMVMNLGPATIVALELSPPGQGQYGPSLIGRVELPPGNALHVTPPPRGGCHGDLRIRFADGRVVDRAREDLCQAQRVLRVSSAPP